MIGRMFGGTRQEQLEFLRPRCWMTLGVLLVSLGVSLFWDYGGTLGVLGLSLIWGSRIWAWWSRFTTGEDWTGGNVVAGLCLLPVCMVVVQLLGLGFGILGLGRWLWLLVGRVRERKRLPDVEEA